MDRAQPARHQRFGRARSQHRAALRFVQGAYGQALEGYNAAITVFERENTGLDESIAAIRAGKLVEGLLERNPGEEMGWFWNIHELPQMPHAGHLTQVLAQHEFQEAFKNYRDLQFLAGNLKRWQDSLGVFGDMLATRRKAYAERLPKVLAQAAQTGLPELTERSKLLGNELATPSGRRWRACRRARARLA